ncbi:MAG: polysaccharide biosynthesis/export family protein [Gammaproteobacteria bacterium]|nr:polysaccharide biosynthesis/export family protein [Gammaproteobacteria bacterium]
MREVSVPVLVICGLMLTACASNTTKVKPDKIVPDGNEEAIAALKTFTVNEYKIGADDVLQINVWRNPELTTTVPVRPDGKISLPLVGDVVVGGLSPADVARNIENKLKIFIRTPQVSVILTQLNSHQYLSRVRVTGAVGRPLSVPYRQGMTVLDIVLEAGGPNDFASPNRTKLYRKAGEKTEVIRINLEDILTKGRLKTNVSLQPGDVLIVPERIF